MPQASIRHYLDQLPNRQAEMRSMLMEAAVLPYQKESHRRSVLNGLRRQLEAGRPLRRPSRAELALIGIGVEYVSATQTGTQTEQEHS